MKYCENCGSPLEDNAKFCEECGVRQEKVESREQKKLNKKEKRMDKKWMFSMLSIGVLFIICVIGFTTSFFNKNQNKENLLVHKNSQLQTEETSQKELKDKTTEKVTEGKNEKTIAEEDSEKTSDKKSSKSESNTMETEDSYEDNKEKNKENDDAEEKVVAELAKTYYNYLQQLENKEAELEEQAMDTQSMNKAASETFQMWDNELNALYQKLKATLPQQEFEQLRQKQRDWIAYKENEVEKVRQEWLGGTGEYSATVSTEAEITKKRVYELAKQLYGSSQSSIDTIIPVIEGTYWEGNKSPTGALYYIKITNRTSKGFDFEIFGRDSMEEEFSTVFWYHTAVYTSSNTAIYYGQSYTLKFHWEKQGYLSVEGFSERIPSSDILYNSDYLGVS